MSLKKLTWVVAWTLLSGLFLIAPILLANGTFPGWVGLPISLIPCFAITLVLLSSIKTRKIQFTLLSGVLFAIVWFSYVKLLQPEYIFLANFTIINSLFFWIFGRTLHSNSIPLCTRFAELVHERMSHEILAYTRGLTYVWSTFFAAQVVLWIALFLTLPTNEWFQLITIVPPALIIILFLFDWIARQFILPKEDRKNTFQLTIQAIIKHRQGLGKTFSE